MPAQQPTTTPRSPQRARRANDVTPVARRVARVGFALPTVREVPRRSVRELPTW